MPKVKTHRGAAKRITKTGSGRFKRSKAGKRHILTKKASNRKRHLRHSGLVSETMHKTVELLLPYL